MNPLYPGAHEANIAVVYAIYAVVSVVLTFFLARTLFRNGQVYLDAVFADDPRMAAAVNRLLVVGFYLVNIGYACLLLEGGFAPNARAAIETLANKLGLLLMSLAVMHFVNMFVFHRMRRRARLLHETAPPIAPHAHVA